MIIRAPTPDDNDTLCRLFNATPMGNRIQVVFDRSPDFFVGARIQADSPWTLAAFDERTGKAIGCFSAGTRRVFVHGKPRDVRYLSDLRIHPNHRGGRLLFEGYRRLGQMMGPGEIAQTIILKDNARALKLLTSRRAGLPHYFPAGTYATLFLPAGQRRRRESSSYTILRASQADIPSIQAFHTAQSQARDFAPVIDFAKLAPSLAITDFLLAYHGKQLVSLIGLWDQSTIRRVRIHRYAPLLKVARPFSTLLSGIPLPREGDVIPITYLTSTASHPDHLAALRALVDHALAQLPRRRLLVAGFDTRDPSLQAFRGLRQRRECGQHFLVAYDAPPKPTAGPFVMDPGRI